MTLTNTLPFLKRTLSPQRLQHSLGVMQVMLDLADIYQLDERQAEQAGLLHDVAKELSHEESLALVEAGQVSLYHPCERHPVYLHALVGAFWVSTELGLVDEAVCDAIAAHSNGGSGRNFHAPLSRCLRIADLLAPVKAWLGMPKLRHVVYAGRLEEATLLQSVWLIEYFQQTDIPIHPHVEQTVVELSAKLQVEAGFFARE